MRRSICLCEPGVAFAGDLRTWRFSYTPAIALPKGTRFKFDLLSQGKTSDWQIPEENPKNKENMIWAELPNGKPLTAKEVEAPLSAAFEFVLPQEVKAGEAITILMGTPEKSREMQMTKGNRAQTNVQRRRPFHLFIDPKGKGDYKEAEVFSLDVRGNVLENIQITVPSIVAKNKRFDVFLRFEDRFGNLTGNAPEGTLIELSYEQLRENLSWKLFIPETGFITLPNLYFNEAGIYKIQLLNTKTGEKFYSAPIKCFADYDKSLYWGLLHGESEKYDAQENIEACLRHFRDERGLQLFSSSPFEAPEETSNEAWKQICHYIAEMNEEARFTTFLGFQWFGEAADEGLRHLIYWKDNRPLLRKKEAKTNSLKKIYKSHTPKEIMSIPCLTMAKGFTTTFEDMTPEFERVVEIYNAWGSSECSEKEGNSRPIKSLDKSGVQETDAGSIREALNRNCRFGFVAGGLDDRGVYDGFFESEQVQYSPGLTAILAIEQTRDTLLQALYNRSCYATTGARIVLGFNIAGFQIGSELSTKTKPGLAFNRHITGFVAGTTPLKEVIIIRNGKPFHTFHPKKTDFEFTLDDSDLLAKTVLFSSDERPPFAYYYLKVVQEDGHIAWASPIWVDYPDFQNGEANKKAKKR